MKYCLLLLFSVLVANLCHSQSFITQQRSNARVAAAFKAKDDTLKAQFAQMGLQYPPKQIYIRSFKYDSQLEVWVRNNSKEQFKLFKTYKVCALSGSLGPKRVEGDYQVPEGFYYISEFKPSTEFHLALGLNYPNASDELLSDSTKPGGDIYIHGNCLTVGCIPIKDDPIEEVYVLATHAKNNGQDFIPVHIFPIRYDVPKSVEYLIKVSNEDKIYQKFAINIKEVFDYFQFNKKLPIIAVNAKGEYVVF
jgi:murein L,D-transpeptidase YafK